MKFVKFDINKHNLNKVANLIYETDSKILNFYFKNRENAVKRIEKLIKAGNNSWGHEYIYIASGDIDQVFGVLVAYRGDETGIKDEFKTYFKSLNFVDALKFVFLEIVYMWIGADLNKDDLYLSDLAVYAECRGKGIGTFILEKSLELAMEKGCKRVILDVDIENIDALRLYKRVGFKIYNKKNTRWFGGKGFYNMEYRLI